MPAMAPDAEDCETARLNTEYNGVPQGRRVLPDQPQPTQAWLENEDTLDRSPGENRRLLPTTHLPTKTKPVPKSKAGLQAGVTLGVHSKYPQKVVDTKTLPKTKFQKRKEKLIEILKPPYFILTMIIVNVGIHMFGSEDLRATLDWSPAAWRHEPWRLLTYGMLHASPAHLALNCLVALAVGWCLEREQGWWRVVCVWVAGVWSGALGAGAFQPDVHVVGASAAVYALLTAHLPNVCLRFGHVPLWWFRPLSVLVLGASEGCWALMRSDGEGVDKEQLEHVAWSAHVLGAAVGVPIGFLVFKGENEKTLPMVVARIVSVLLLVTGVTLATIHYTF